jgi:elongation factor G
MDKKRIPLNLVRNIGIIAHIDAGKTTTTESILYYTGRTHKIGEVHEGDTVMDWMDQERERGITITSAATTAYWTFLNKLHRINIIDTPGHVDFTVEVERSLRVLDGAVVLFDGKMGVEPQSETVWRQADKYQVPRICFINKINQTGGDYEKSYESIRERLTSKATMIQFPIGIGLEFSGTIDIVKQKAYVYTDADHLIYEEREIPEEYKARVNILRNLLIERIVEADDKVMEAYLEGKEPDESIIDDLIRKATIQGIIVPVLGGDGRKVDVKLLLDAIVKYLPSPLDRNGGKVIGHDPDSIDDAQVVRSMSDTEPLTALAFKLMTDPNVGKLVFFRVYSGVLKSGSYIYNPRTRQKERVSRILMMHANHREEVEEVRTGEIAALVRVKDLKTGDTLCDPEQLIRLESIKFAEPVVSVAVEPKTKADQEKMGLALQKLGDEDPTFRVTVNQETGQTVLSGMGELHIEIMVDRMKREFKVDANIGKPQVAFRESISMTVESEGKYIKQSGGRGQYGHCWLRLEPMERGKGYEFVNETKGGSIPREYIPEIEKGVKKSLDSGVTLGFPVVDVRVVVYDGSYHEVDSNGAAFQAAGSIAFREGMKRAAPIILEPIMKVEVVTPEEYMGDVTGMLASKRGVVLGMDMRGQARVVKAEVPLANMFGFTTELRSMSSGRASSSMEFSKYEVVPANLVADLNK